MLEHIGILADCNRALLEIECYPSTDPQCCSALFQLFEVDVWFGAGMACEIRIDCLCGGTKGCIFGRARRVEFFGPFWVAA